MTCLRNTIITCTWHSSILRLLGNQSHLNFRSIRIVHFDLACFNVDTCRMEYINSSVFNLFIMMAL